MLMLIFGFLTLLTSFPVELNQLQLHIDRRDFLTPNVTPCGDHFGRLIS